LNYDVLSRKPLIFKSFTGLEVQEFDALHSKIQESHAPYEEKRLHREDSLARTMDNITQELVAKVSLYSMLVKM